MKNPLCRPASFLVILVLLLLVQPAQAWWKSDWTIRKKIEIDTSTSGLPISDKVGSIAILLRLHDGNFHFTEAKEDGSDLRFIAADEKTVLAYHIEKYDALLNEAFVWVKLPEVAPGAKTTFWMYYGNAGGTATRVDDAKATYDVNTALVYHFAEPNAPARDSTTYGNNAETAGISVSGALIGPGIRFDGANPITIPNSEPLAWTDGGTLTWSAWIKPAANQPNAIVFRREAFIIGVDNGVPFVDVNGARTAGAPPLEPNTWHHLAVTTAGSTITLYVDGQSTATLNTAVPASTAPLLLGGDASGGTGFNGEMDELEISKVARPAGFIKVSAFSQGPDKAGKLMAFANDEQKTGWFSGGGTLSVLVGSLTVDGWIVIVILAFMAVMSWWLMYNKIRYLNSISKGNALFLQEWKHIANDLTAIDDDEEIRTMGGRVDEEGQRAMRTASVYRIYHIGVEEIRYRIAADNAAEGTRKGLAGRSIQAIRASLDGGLVRETQKLNRLIVLLTICISGGPFLGLLGTVIGVMITFAAIAAAGDVNVNAIAPGIAAALLATVAGLAVAIPALFGYNYIISRVKDAKDDMVIFIDEFVTKMAEFYRETPPNYGNQPQLFQESVH